jgi:hypothetical protein
MGKDNIPTRLNESCVPLVLGRVDWYGMLRFEEIDAFIKGFSDDTALR